MNLIEAEHILNQNGFLMESSIKGDFAKNETGGNKFYDLPNDYTRDDAIRYFLSAIYGEEMMNADDEKVQVYLENYLKKPRLKQFERTYAQFEKYKNGTPIKLYRGLILDEDEKPNLNETGVCWSFSQDRAKRWAEDIFDGMVNKHIAYGKTKFLLSCTTSLENTKLPFSIWLAGYNDGNEWEVRLEDETKVKILSCKEI
jgi:hypothetical protein